MAEILRLLYVLIPSLKNTLRILEANNRKIFASNINLNVIGAYNKFKCINGMRCISKVARFKPSLAFMPRGYAISIISVSGRKSILQT